MGASSELRQHAPGGRGVGGFAEETCADDDLGVDGEDERARRRRGAVGVEFPFCDGKHGFVGSFVRRDGLVGVRGRDVERETELREERASTRRRACQDEAGVAHLGINLCRLNAAMVMTTRTTSMMTMLDTKARSRRTIVERGS